MIRVHKAVIAVAILATATSLYAQLTGRLTGTVIDPSGASVAGARVGLYLPGGKSPLLATETNAEGSFTFSAVRPDLYRLTVEVSGFSKYELADVKIDPARQLGLPPIRLEVAATSQAVEVTTSAAAIDTTTAEISTTVTQSQIENLPVLGRQVVNLFNTQAGVTQNNRTATVINGMRPSYTNVTYDGINVQDSVRTNDVDLLNNRFTIAQVAEFTVSTTNANPTIGGGASTIVLSSPSGTNNLHGSGYWFNRNNFFGANDWFNNKNGIVRPRQNLNQIGGTVGGAIVKDKLFFYGAYEAYRLHRQTPKTLTILTPTARQGILQYTVNGGPPQQYDVMKAQGLAFSPAVQKFLDLVPTVGNNNAVGDGLNTTGYTFNARANTIRDNVTGKVDYNLSTKHVFTGTYSWNRDVPDRNDGTYYTVIPPTYNDNHINLVSLSWRWTPRATLTNEVRGGFEFANVPFVLRQQSPGFYLTFPTNFLSTPYQSTEIGEGRNGHQYNIQDNANWSHGKHTVSFGFQTSLLTASSYNYNSPVTPIYTIGLGTSPYGFNTGDIPGANSSFIATANNLIATLGGLISGAQQGFNVTSQKSGFVAGAPSILNQRWDQYALYAFDTFKVARNLTLSFGLRWDYFAPVDETDGLASMPHLINNNPITTLLGNATLDFTGTSVGYPFYKKDLNNFAPNVGLAFDPFENGKTSIRAGFNIAYLNDNTLNSVYNSAIGVNNGLSTVRSLASLNARADALPVIATPQFQFPTSTLAQFNLSPSSPPVEGLVDPNLATPYVEQWTFGIQHEVKGFVFEGRYVGNHALKMYRGLDFNQININQGDFLADFIRARNNGFASLNAGKGFVPTYNSAVPGSQPLTYLTNLPATALTNATLLGNIRTGEIGTYAQNLMSLFPYPALGMSFFPNPYLLYATELSNRSTANYNGLQLEVRKHTRSGIQFQGNYTFSKALTDANALRAIDAQIDNAAPQLERARADYDLTHVFKFNYYMPLPIGTGHRFSSNNRVMRRVLDGWALSGIGVLQTGSPVSILSGRGTINRGARSVNNTVDTSDNISQLHDITGLFMTGNGPYWIDPTHIGADTRGVAADGSAPFAGQVFFNPQPGTQGSLQKRALDGPPFRSFNFSTVKTFKITERQTLDLHADFFNILNHPNFFLNDQTVNNTGFGRITTQNTSNDGVGPRSIQFGLYYRF
jgi:hypothetical protein